MNNPVNKVLFVDDEQCMRDLFVLSLPRILNSPGLRVITAETNDAARRAFTEHTFDIVIIDIFLGSESGLDVIRECRGQYPDLPIFALTASAERYCEQALQASATRVLAKPIENRGVALAIACLERTGKKILVIDHEDAWRRQIVDEVMTRSAYRIATAPRWNFSGLVTMRGGFVPDILVLSNRIPRVSELLSDEASSATIPAFQDLLPQGHRCPVLVLGDAERESGWRVILKTDGVKPELELRQPLYNPVDLLHTIREIFAETA